MIRNTLMVLLLGSIAAPLQAEVISKACVAHGRQAATRALCGCIQDAADLTLTKGEQRQAADFFKNPEKAQKARTADSRAKERFWSNYTAFIEVAETYCAEVSD